MEMIECMEARCFLSGGPVTAEVSDPGNTPGTALNLGAIGGTRSLSGSIGAKDSDDYFKFSLKSRGNFNLTLSGLSGNADAQILSSTAEVLDNASNGGSAAEKISRSLDKGTYYVRVLQGSAGAHTSYTLQLVADLNYGFAKLGGERREIGLNFANGSTKPILANRDTWIIIHGWLGDPEGNSLPRLAEAIAGQSKRNQVLMLDWSSAAADANLLDAAAWTPAVANFVRARLTQWGVPTGRINLAAHSLGALVADDIAGDVSGGVNRIIAMDPATDLPGLFISGTDFADHSRFSVAFLGSAFATPEAAATADEAFKLNVGDPGLDLTHGNVVDLVASMIDANNSQDPDRISRLFAVNQLVQPSSRPFKPDAFSDDFEGTITGEESGGHWFAKTFVYKSRATGKKVTLTA
jgi:pimeloyl-ACP methyl ester carboxylesterase